MCLLSCSVTARRVLHTCGQALLLHQQPAQLYNVSVAKHIFTWIAVLRTLLLLLLRVPQGGEGGGEGERFWNVREVLEGAPEDLVFEDDGLDALVV